MKVNLGAGANPLPGYMNVDWDPKARRDVLWEYDSATETGWANYNLDHSEGPMPLIFAQEDSVDEFVAKDFLEHIRYPLPLLQECWRIAKPGAVFHLALPYGTSDDAWEDPTHVRPYYIGSWRYFSQPIYYLADYGYTADWNVDEIVLDVPADSPNDVAELRQMVSMFRNVVERQYVRMTAVKPARPRDPSLLAHPNVVFRRVGHG